MDFTLPDGTIITGVPEGTSRAEVYARAIMAGMGTSFAAPEDPTAGMSDVDKFRAGWGKWLREQGMGISQRFGGTTEADVEAMRRRDQPLMQTGAGKAGYFTSGVVNPVLAGYGGQMVSGLVRPALAGWVPGANTLRGTVGLSTALGAAAPTDENENAAFNIALSNIFGVGGHALGRTIGGAPPIKTQLNPVQQEAVDLAQKHGIEMTAGGRTGNRALQYLESQIATMFGGGPMRRAIAKPQEQLGAAVMREAGQEGPATRATLEAAKKSSSQGYRNIWAGKTIEMDGEFTTALDAARKEGTRLLGAGSKEANQLNAQIDNIWRNSFPITSREGTLGVGISGDVYQLGLRPALRRAGAGEDTTLGHALGEVKKALDKLARRNVGKSEATALQQLDTEWAIQKQLFPLIDAATARGGTFTPAQLVRPLGSFKGTPGELSRIGPLLREVPESGTTQRAIASAALYGGGPALIAAMGHPLTAMASLAAPAIAGKALSTPRIQNYLVQGFGKLTQREKDLLMALARGSATGSPMLLAQPQ